MRPRIELLECRRLFSGGVDASFGGAGGAPFVAPGDASHAAVLAVKVDPGGRVMVGGQTPYDNSDMFGSQMFLTRLGADGQPDPRFGDGGTITGTPRALNSVDFIVPLPSGG